MHSPDPRSRSGQPQLDGLCDDRPDDVFRQRVDLCNLCEFLAGV